MCRYEQICPAYNCRSEICEKEQLVMGWEYCIPMILEAYRNIKGTPYDDIKYYLGFNICQKTIENHDLLTIFKRCDLGTHIHVYEEFEKVFKNGS